LLRLEVSGEGTLTEQLTSRLRSAILSGALTPGTVLPTLAEMAQTIGSSERVPRAAVRRLQTENLIRARPRIGCIVLPSNAKTWCGRVVIVGSDSRESFYHRSFCNALVDRLVRARYHVEQLRVRPDEQGRTDLSELNRILGEPCDLVFVMGYDRLLQAQVLRARLPYFVFGPAAEARGPGYVGNFESLCDKAVGQLAARAVRAGLRSVLQVTFEGGYDATSDFKKAGLAVKSVRVTPSVDARRLQSFIRCGYDAVRAALAKRRELPDLLFVTDDHLAFGGIVALASSGLEAPRDLAFAAFSNEGLGLVYPHPVTAVVSDSVADGALVARRLVDYLTRGVKPGQVLVQRTLAKGKTLSKKRQINPCGNARRKGKE